MIRYFIKSYSVAVVAHGIAWITADACCAICAKADAATVYPVNPGRAEAQEMQAWPNVADLAEPTDLAVVVVPSHAVAGVVESCGKRAILACVVITAGFGEHGAESEGAEGARRAGAQSRCGASQDPTASVLLT